MEFEQNAFFQKEKQIKHQAEEFIFPPDQVFEETFDTFNEVIIHIQKHEARDQILFKNLFRRKRRGSYLFLLCRFCASFISLKQKQRVHFVKFNNKHVHSNLHSKGQQQRVVMQTLTQQLLNHNIDQAKLIVKSKYRLSSNRVNYIWQKYNKNTKFNSILCYLQSQNYRIRTYQGIQTDISQLVIAISPSMFKCYKQFGDVVTFDVTYNILRRRSRQNHQWGLGILSGFGSNLQPVVFGYCLIARQTKQAFTRLFQNFFEMFGVTPNCLISDEQLAIKQALIQLRESKLFLGYHYNDSFHLLKNLRRKTTQKAFPFYKYLLKARNQSEYQTILGKLLENQQNLAVAEAFDQQKSRNCFSNLENEFVGFNSTSSRGEVLNQLVKRKIPRQVNLLTLIRTLHSVFQRINLRSQMIKTQNRKYELLFSDFHLKDVRISVGFRVFQQFLKSYVKGLRMEAISISEFIYSVTHGRERFLVNMTEQVWKCSCNFTIKTGTPCEHLIKVLWITRRFRYIDYFNIRWKSVKRTEAQQVINQRGRPKKSRRNRLY